MTASLDWHIEDEPIAPVQARRRFWHNRRFWVLLGLVIVPLLAFAGMMLVDRRQQDELAAQVRHVAEMEEAARRSGDMGRFLMLQDRINEAWLGLQAFRFRQGSLYAVPELGLIDADGPVVYNAVRLEEGFARLDVTRPFSVTLSNGDTRAMQLTLPQFYRPWGDGWAHTLPPLEWWGPLNVYAGRRLTLSYPAREAEHMQPLAARLDTWMDRACADWDCPSEVRYTVVFSPTARALLWLNRARFVNHVLTLPSVSLVAWPTGAGLDDPVALGYGRLLVRALALELSGYYDYGHSLLEALVAAEGARLGLMPRPRPDRSPEVYAAWRGGRLDLWGEFRDLTTTQADAQAVVAFVSEMYGEEGERRLLRSLYPTGPLASRLARELGLPLDALVEAWLAYGQAHWSRTAGQPPPTGELALICGSTARLYDLASGMAREIVQMPRSDLPWPAFPKIVSAAWSPKGVWLALTVRTWGDDAVLLKNLVTGEERNFKGAFRAWAPDGRRFALYQPSTSGPGQTVIADLSTGSLQALAEGAEFASWSPVGDQLAYISYSSDGSGPTIWVAAADGTQARSLARGSLPVWSPDSRSLAYVPASPSAPQAELALLEVSTGVTRALFSTSDLPPAPDLLPAWGAAVLEASWSPDGKTLAVVAHRPGSSQMNLVTLAADESTQYRASPRLWMETDWIARLSWSPDGRYLAAIVRSYDPYAQALWLADAYGRAYVNLIASDYRWSPDGRWLAVQQEAGPAVFSVDLPGTGQIDPLLLPVWRLPPRCALGDWHPQPR
jgi:hypothetical protein